MENAPYVYKKPEGCTAVDQPPSREYSHIEKSFAIVNESIESHCKEEETRAKLGHSRIVSGILYQYMSEFMNFAPK